MFPARFRLNLWPSVPRQPATAIRKGAEAPHSVMPIRNWGSLHANFPNSVWASQNVVLLPLYGSLSLADAERLARGLVEIERETSCRAVQISGLDSGNERLAVTSLARQTL